MSLSCYIVDDEIEAAEVLRDFIAEIPELHLLKITTSAVNALDDLAAEDLPDIVFLDIDMPKVSGLLIAKKIKGKTQIIFTTAHRDYAPEAFDHAATDYLLKPIGYSRFLEAIDRVKAKVSPEFQRTVDQLLIPGGAKSRMTAIPFKEICFIKGLSDYSEIQCLSKKHVVHISLKELLVRLPGELFTRVHKSFIINHNHIKSVTGTMVAVQNEIIPIGRAFKSTFNRKLAAH